MKSSNTVNVNKEVTALLQALGLTTKPEQGSSISFLLFEGFYDQKKITLDLFCDISDPAPNWCIAEFGQ